MIRQRWFTSATVLLLGLAGTTLFEDRVARLERAFRASERYELISLDPTYRDEDQRAATRPSELPRAPATQPATRPTLFYGYRVYGSTVIEPAKERDRLNDVMFKGPAEFMDGAAGCFKPRHGARLTRRDAAGEHVTDVLICFECAMLIAYEDGGPAQQSILRFTEDEERDQPIFDAVLKAAGVPLAPPPPPEE